MKRETKLRGLDNQLKALLPDILEIREEVIEHRECAHRAKWDRFYRMYFNTGERDQVRSQKKLDKLMVKYRRINSKRRQLRIIQKCKQLSIL